MSKRLKDFILESELFEGNSDEDNEGVSTKSNKERKKLLEKYLRNKNYEDYIEELQEMLKDPKAKALLEDAFGGELGDTQLKFSIKNISVERLMPTQNEIDLDKSLKRGLTNPENIDKFFEKQVKLFIPLVSFNDMYIIDGHHRWSQVYCFNPKAQMVCANYSGDLSPIQMLKATQGAIAADPSIKELPVSKVEGVSIYDNKKCNKQQLTKYVSENISDGTIEKLKKYVDEITDKKSAIEYIVNNCLRLKVDHSPMHNAPSREVMPQTDKSNGGNDSKGKELYNKEKSALSRMKEQPVTKI